ncbi:MAG: hypothetical protein KJ065_13850 [Anaerolineae bacterium]|nr:hypothetical protein [Anaerolineae bacterium]
MGKVVLSTRCSVLGAQFWVHSTRFTVHGAGAGADIRQRSALGVQKESVSQCIWAIWREELHLIACMIGIEGSPDLDGASFSMIGEGRNRSWLAFLIYLFVGVFPGCLCAHLLRIAAISDNLVSVVSGIGLLILPFSLLSLLLILLLKNKSTTDHIAGLERRRFYFLCGLVLLAFAVAFFIGFIESTFRLHDIFANESQLRAAYSGNSPPFTIQFVTAWAGSFLFGLAVLMFGSSIYQHKID